jgi:choline dehydrogenase-like flavoprotein
VQLDISELDRNFELACDVAIVGAGAAGITLARELAGARLEVVLLESGGLEPERETQELYRGGATGLPYPDLAATRLRYFGGTTNHWSGELGVLDPGDFESRPWLPDSGWPISSGDLLPFYGRALSTCGVDTRLDSVAGRAGAMVKSERLRLAHRRRNRGGPLRFGSKYREDLARAANVRLLLHSNVTEIVSGAANRVERLAVRALGGRRGTVRARSYVLACGGIENARLLLASARSTPGVAGLGADWIGRCFMDHPVHRPLRLLASPHTVAALLPSRAGGVIWLPDLVPLAGYQAQEAIGSFGAELHEVSRETGIGDDAWLETAWRLHEEIEGPPPAGKPPALYEIEIMQEQAPNRSSRVTLAGDRDELGLPRVSLDYRHAALDARTARVAATTIARELGRLGFGRVGLAGGFEPEGTAWDWPWRVAQHQLGTTRMANDPSRGATDRDGRVFGVGNLFVAGGSLFPTAGYVNPTGTIVALALRLAERLRVAA